MSVKGEGMTDEVGRMDGMGYCVTNTPTICDGTVLRWYASESALLYGNFVVSASRNGVHGHGGPIAPDMFRQAWDAHLLIKEGGDVGHLATHRTKRVFGSDYERIGTSE